MKKWTKNKAVQVVNLNGGVIDNKVIISVNGFRGLTTCSAYDFLVNYCGYKRLK